jgi:hypothetical protein
MLLISWRSFFVDDHTTMLNLVGHKPKLCAIRYVFLAHLAFLFSKKNESLFIYFPLYSVSIGRTVNVVTYFPLYHTTSQLEKSFLHELDKTFADFLLLVANVPHDAHTDFLYAYRRAVGLGASRLTEDADVSWIKNISSSVVPTFEKGEGGEMVVILLTGRHVDVMSLRHFFLRVF